MILEAKPLSEIESAKNTKEDSIQLVINDIGNIEQYKSTAIQMHVHADESTNYEPLNANVALVTIEELNNFQKVLNELIR